jgi:hypothetical protein
MKLRNGDEQLVQNEIEVLEKEKNELASQKSIAWGDFLKNKTLFRPLLVTITVHAGQQFSGIFII